MRGGVLERGGGGGETPMHTIKLCKRTRKWQFQCHALQAQAIKDSEFKLWLSRKELNLPNFIKYLAIRTAENLN